MKTVRLLFIFILVLLLTGCKEYGEKRIVKLLTVNSEQISLYYYDYSAEKQEYSVETKENTGIENTLVQILSENDYDLKLCRYAVCEKDIIENNMSELFAGLINSKFSTDTVIIQGDTHEQPEKYIELKNYSYPVYSYYVEADKVNGIVENPDDSSKNVITEGKLYTVLNAQKSFAFDIVKGNIDEGIYVFEQNGISLSADIENISTFCSVKNDTATVTVNALLKSYKGMPSNEKAKRQFIAYLKNSLQNDITELLNDMHMSQKLGLNWFANLGSYSSLIVDVNLK